MSKLATHEGSEKRGIFPFVSQNIIPGKFVVVKSHQHRRELMKRHGLLDARDFSQDYRIKKRRDYVEEKGQEKKTVLEKTFRDARNGRIDLRPFDVARRKREWQERNGR